MDASLGLVCCFVRSSWPIMPFCRVVGEINPVSTEGGSSWRRSCTEMTAASHTHTILSSASAAAPLVMKKKKKKRWQLSTRRTVKSTSSATNTTSSFESARQDYQRLQRKHKLTHSKQCDLIRLQSQEVRSELFLCLPSWRLERFNDGLF